MGILKDFAVWGKKARRTAPAGTAPKAATGRAILLFRETGEVIRAEAALKKGGLAVKVKAPPPALRTGCDLVIEIPLIHVPAVRAALGEARLTPLQILPVSDELLEPVSVFQKKDYGEYLMVRAANMKICVEKKSGRIVNVSGGGCPDVPYLAKLLVGETLAGARPPLERGRTLCGYALQLAFDEAKQCVGSFVEVTPARAPD